MPVHARRHVCLYCLIRLPAIPAISTTPPSQPSLNGDCQHESAAYLTTAETHETWRIPQTKLSRRPEASLPSMPAERTAVEMGRLFMWCLALLLALAVSAGAARHRNMAKGDRFCAAARANAPIRKARARYRGARNFSVMEVSHRALSKLCQRLENQPQPLR
jgi:hypothetical protein